MEFIDIYDNLGQKCGMTLGKDEAHKNALIHKGVCAYSNGSLFVTKQKFSCIFTLWTYLSIYNIMFPNLYI